METMPSHAASILRRKLFRMACRMLAPRHRPPARGGPTIYGRLVPLVERSSLVGPPLAGGLRCRPVTGSQHTACRVKRSIST